MVLMNASDRLPCSPQKTYLQEWEKNLVTGIYSAHPTPPNLQ